MGNPDATTLARIAYEATGDFQAWIRDRKNRRVIPHRLEKCGYVPVRNDYAKDGLWKIYGARQAVYAKEHPLDPGPDQGCKPAYGVMSVKIRNVFQERPIGLISSISGFLYSTPTTPLFTFFFYGLQSVRRARE